jgi:hypothetical protein
MSWKIGAVALGAVLLSGCLMPRSAGIGQTADMLRKGQAEIGLSPGLVYQSATQPAAQQGDPTTSVGGVNFPASEGNAAYGINDTIGLNLHLSPAGLQPGVKIALMRGAFDVAVMPSVAIGVFSQSAGTTEGSTTTSSSESYLGLMAGLKILGSHRSGFYGGVGYDLQSVGMSGTTGSGNNNTSSESTLSHNLSIGAGYEAKFGAIRIRPELAMTFTPGMSRTSTSGSNTETVDAGSGFYFFPNVTIAVVGGSR